MKLSIFTKFDMINLVARLTFYLDEKTGNCDMGRKVYYM